MMESKDIKNEDQHDFRDDDQKIRALVAQIQCHQRCPAQRALAQKNDPGQGRA